MSTTQTTDDLLSAVESYIDTLPISRRRRQTTDDDAPEAENYAGIDPAAVMVHCALNHADQVALMLLLWDLGRARGVAECGAICRKIWAMVGLTCDLPSYYEALNRACDDAAARRKGGAR